MALKCQYLHLNRMRKRGRTSFRKSKKFKFLIRRIDRRAFKRFSLDVPDGSTIYGDRAYNNYELEDFLADHTEIRLIVQRRKNTKRPLRAELKYLQSRMRTRIETVFSQITRIFPRSINAVTSKGFEIKLFNFVLAYTFDLFFKHKFALA